MSSAATVVPSSMLGAGLEYSGLTSVLNRKDRRR